MKKGDEEWSHCSVLDRDPLTRSKGRDRVVGGHGVVGCWGSVKGQDEVIIAAAEGRGGDDEGTEEDGG